MANNHGLDKKAAKEAAKLIKQGNIPEARRLIALISPKARQESIDRIVRGIQLSQGNG